MIKNIWACSCGAETECRLEDLKIGAVFQCPDCRRIFGCVHRKDGDKVWVKICSKEAAFHRLLKDS